MKRHILLVHGHHFKPAAETLSELWNQALEWALMRDKPEAMPHYEKVTRSLAYFGDLNNQLLSQAGHPYDEALDIADQRNALASLKELNKAKRFRRRDYAQLPGRTSIKKRVADITAPLLHSLRMKEHVLAKVAPELVAYWNADSEYSQSVSDRLDQALISAIAGCDKLLVVAHGFGSIAIYDALWRLSHWELDIEQSQKIDFLLTLGSPLGDETVKKKLYGSRHELEQRYPNNVVSWANLAATDDFVSHDRTLADDYRPMLDRRLISRINDYRVHNLSVRYGRSNPHSALGYLIHPRSATLISEWLTRE